MSMGQCHRKKDIILGDWGVHMRKQSRLLCALRLGVDGYKERWKAVA